MPLNPQDVTYVLNDCRIKLPGASDSGIRQELWGVIKEFLTDSNAWVENMRLNVVANTQTYDIVPREGGQIIRLLGVLDGNRVPVAVTMPNFGQLVFTTPIQISSVSVPITDMTVGPNYPWYVGVVKTIAFPATRDDIPIAPDFVMRVYSQAIIDGVLGRMMTQQAKTYTNLPQGKYHLQRFRDEIGIARSEARVQNLFGGQRWQFPAFAGGSQRGGYGTCWPFPGRF